MEQNAKLCEPTSQNLSVFAKKLQKCCEQFQDERRILTVYLEVGIFSAAIEYKVLS